MITGTRRAMTSRAKSLAGLFFIVAKFAIKLLSKTAAYTKENGLVLFLLLLIKWCWL